MWKRAVIGTLIVGMLLAAGVASAQQNGPSYPGQRPATDERIMVEVALAMQYWRARGQTACMAGVQVFYARTLVGSDGGASGRGGDCRAWFMASDVRDWRDVGWDAPRAMRREDARQECRLVFHEIGHALGLPHVHDGSVMDPDAFGVPYPCRKWARWRYPPLAHAERHKHGS